jgi:hypothetical protein
MRCASTFPRAAHNHLRRCRIARDDQTRRRVTATRTTGAGSLTSLTRRSRLRLPEANAALSWGEHEAMAGFSEEEKTLLLTLLRRSPPASFRRP